jgi:hypothetical protein
MKIVFIFIFGFFNCSLDFSDYVAVMVAFVIPALAWRAQGNP